MSTQQPAPPAPGVGLTRARPQRVGRFLTFALPASAGLYAVYQGVQAILLPSQVAEIDPSNKVANLAIITTVFSIASTLVLPIAGAWSDRTRSRFGRRAPWIAGSAAIAAILLVILSGSVNLFALGTLVTLLWLVLNVFQAPLTAAVPDRIPVSKRGLGSSIFGLGLPVGTLIGLQLAAHLPRSQGYWALAAVLVVFTAAFLVFAREKPYLRDELAVTPTRPGMRIAFAAFFSSFRSRDFSLAFVARFLLFLAYFTVSGYLFYILQDLIGTENVPGGNVAVAVSTITSIAVIVWVFTSVFFGLIADRLDRRKLFVALSAIGMAITLAIPIVFPTWTGMLFYAVFSGLFFGIYLGVDLALMTLVLPDKDREGRDLGVLAVATSAPQILSPVVAALLITFLGGYTTLFIFAIAAAAVGGVVALLIRGVR
ncbi:MFS transporter [Herbiconiux sp. P17]|uniref:MFS transporter n=1 Tax=Herbiconiux wuyangfengii TaxID=3342794 RepID=UPI0035B9A3FF